MSTLELKCILKALGEPWEILCRRVTWSDVCLERHHRSVVRVGIEESQGTGNSGDAWPGSVREGLPQEVKSER